MSVIKTGTTSTTGYIVESDTNGNLVIQTGSTPTTALTLNSNQTATFAQSVNIPNTFGFKNRIINGAMMIDQRNAGASVTPASGAYTVDRWVYFASQASKFTAQQSSVAPAGFTRSLLFTTASAVSVGSSDFFQFQQPIEGFNTADLGWGTANAQSVTLSFWVRSSLTGTFGGALKDASSRSYPFSYIINSANTWEQKTVTIAGDTSGTWATDNSASIRVAFGLGNGSTFSSTAGSWQAGNFSSATGATSVVGTNGATFYITGVQLEKGSTATSFDYRPYGTELALCQRYYEKSYEQSVVPGTATGSGYSLGCVNSNTATTLYSANIDKFAVVKRAAPTMRFWDIAGNLNRVSSYTLGGLARTDNSNSVFSYTGFQQNAVMIDTRSLSTMAGYQWDASSEL